MGRRRITFRAYEYPAFAWRFTQALGRLSA
jgi:hypothetical protein